MHGKLGTGTKSNQRYLKDGLKLGLLTLILLMTFSGVSQAQLLIDSINYAIDIGDFSGLPGTVVAAPIQIKNQVEIGGFLIRFTYNPAFITPYYADGCPTDACPGYCCDSTGISFSPVYDSLTMTGRGLTTVQRDTAGWYCSPFYDERLRYNVQAFDYPFDDSMHINAVFIQFLPPIPPFDECQLNYWDQPTIGSSTTTSTIANVFFKVASGATVGTSTFIRVEDYRPQYGDDPQPDYRDNQFTNVEGTLVIRPIGAFGSGRFTVGEPGPDEPNWDTCSYGICQTTGGADTCCLPSSNHVPSVSSPQASYSIDQGQTVSFSVTASDQDNDFISLLATQLPTGATFTPSNPVTGTGSVQGTFTWTPTYSQSGDFSVIFRATDDANATGSRTVNISVTKLNIDRLYTTSSYGAAPVGGVPGATPVIFPINLITTRTVYGVQFDMIYASLIMEIDSIVVTDLMPEYVVYENIGAFPDSVRVAAFGLNNEPIGDPTTSNAILNAYLTLDSSAIPADYWMKLRNAWESVDPNPAVAGLALLADSGVVQVDRYGDVNLDKQVNVADMVNVVAYIIGNYGLAKRNFETADIVQDGIVNVVDLIGIINTVFGRPIQKEAPRLAEPTGPFAKLRLEHDDLLAGQFTKLNIKGEFPDNVAGVQLQIDYDPNAVSFEQPELSEISGAFTMAYNDDKQGRLKLLIYTYKPWELENLIPTGLNDIMRLPAHAKTNINADDKNRIRITQAYLASSDATEIPTEPISPILPVTFNLYQNYPNPFNPQTRIEFDITRDVAGGSSQVSLDVFNILGQKVSNLLDKTLTPGRYTVEWDGTDDNGRQVATGIYLYRLKVGDSQQARKMLLLK